MRATRKIHTTPVSGRTPEEWADLLVDNVSGATQLPTAAYAADYPDRPALHNEDDWRRNAVALFKLAIERTHAPSLADVLEKALHALRSGDDEAAGGAILDGNAALRAAGRLA